MRSAEFKLLYVGVFGLHLALLWWLPFVPSQDGPSHLYGAVILRDLVTGGEVYGAFFDPALVFKPNLGAAVPLYLLTAALPPIVAEKVFFSTFMGLLVCVVPQLAKLAGNRPFPASLMVFPLLFSRFTLPGFYSLMVGIPLWLWAMCLFWRMRALPLFQRCLAGNACALILFACHLLSLGCYVVACGCAVLCSSSPKTLKARIPESIALLGLPTLLLGGYGLLFATNDADVELSTQNNAVGGLTGFDFHQNVAALLNLITFEQVALSPYQFVSGALLGFVVLWLLCRRDFLGSWRLSDSPLRLDQAHQMARRWLLLTGLILFGVMLCIPDRVGELSLVKMRFGPLILLLVIPLMSSLTLPVPLQRFVMSVALIAALANGVLVTVASRQVHTFVTSVPSDKVRGHLVAGYRGTPANGPIDPLAHATSYYCTLHACVDIDNYQAQSRQFFVRFKRRASLIALERPEASTSATLWERYPEVDYLLSWELGIDEERRVAQAFTMLQKNGGVTLWHRQMTESAK